MRGEDRYDMRVGPKIFKVGEWVWYFSPRKYIRIQKTERSDSFIAHVNKLKHFKGETPVSWLTERKDAEEINTVLPLPEPECRYLYISDIDDEILDYFIGNGEADKDQTTRHANATGYAAEICTMQDIDEVMEDYLIDQGEIERKDRANNRLDGGVTVSNAQSIDNGDTADCRRGCSEENDGFGMNNLIILNGE